ncbi:oligopeptidase B [Dyadobacter sp. BE34]|uniref:Oligopeptidase B n=2 Tax=Spirosomataceae TaxID=2896860 RepID=A0ABU1QX82_9BACT|nr:oligopeptidase B [Dyadobacter fermentans]MDR7042465.1 oligopeptidase B [Dyadobacter sp. BE242]MDR7196778.1 oligopeptidase B [Dyadobacter sp. BE34]MDR7215788.1 oligopeptidase B [Dyadobacter sp. BE31]MDR7263324.1 oligopeptidase B [Dyadobacter sp. BE32]
MKQAYQWPGATPPVATMKDHETGMHGDKRNDEYYWMGDFFREGPDSDKVVEYLKAENAYTDTMMAGTAKFQEALFSEMKGRIKEKDESVPVFSNGYWYYTRSEEGEQYFKYCRKKGSLEAAEEILLDVDKMAEGHPYYSAVGFNVSPDNKLLAYGVDTVSRRQYTLYIKNLETGEHFADKIYPASGGSEWGNDNKTLFYTATNPKTLLSEKIKRHTLGTDSKKDVVVYNEKDKSNYIGVGKTKSDKYIVIASSATMSSEYLILDADKPEGKFEVFQPRMKDVLYDVDHQGDKFLIVTNKDALNFRLMETPVGKTGVENWKEVIPNRADVLLEGIDVFKDHLVITERKNGLLQLRIRNINTNKEHYVDFGEPAYTAYAGSNPEYNSSNLRYIYTSLTTPSSVYDYNMETRDKELKKRQEVVGGYNPEEYVTERLYATVRDGVKVPISVVYKKGTPKSAETPLLLYAYGSYGNSMDAAFSSTRLSLLNRGFIYAIAHIRGGQEMGRQWYEDGKMFKKKNTFNDFIDCAEHLIKENYTSKEHLFAEGGSAGGLLMGAISNMRPDLWRGIIADVPFVDVVTTMLDESIPLTTNEFDEWGNPKNKDAYDYMKSYSPYDNVEKKAYPNMLITTGLHDSQVQYFEPAKWVARLRTHKTDNNVLLLKTNMEAGHGGASGRFDYLKEIALQFAFMFALEGIME